jgi:hypothetical protein
MNFKLIGNPQNYTWVSLETWFLDTPHQTQLPNKLGWNPLKSTSTIVEQSSALSEMVVRTFHVRI